MKVEETMNPVVQAVVSYRREALQAKEKRMAQNKENLDCYHLRQDWSHKQKGQSKEFLAKQNVAVEQLVSFLQQGLVDKKDWFSIELEAGVKEEGRRIRPSSMFKIVKSGLEKADFYTFTGDALKVGSLQSLMIVKVHGKKVPKVKFKTELKMTGLFKMKKVLLKEERDVWQLKIDLIRPEDFYPDPTGKGLYNCQDIEMDLWELKKIAAQANAEKPGTYDLDLIDNLHDFIISDQKTNKARETGQNQTIEKRKTVTITECWGTIVDPNTGDVLHENVVCAIANEKYLIRPPQANPLWHGEDPYVVAPIRRVPFSVWHQALMDAPTKHNRAQNEVYNLMLDAGLQSVFGIRQIRENYLEDPSQISDGIPAGTTLRVASTCPPGQKVLERVDSSTEFSQAATIFNITDREFNSSALTNDLRQGNLPERSTKATEIVSVNQALTGMNNGMVKLIESSFLSKILEKAWVTSAQHLDDFSSDEMKALLGEEEALLISSMSPEERFAETAQGHKFKVFGMSAIVNKINDFRKYQMFLQTIAASPLLMAEFAKRFNVGKLLGEIVKSLDIDTDKIAISDGTIESGEAPENQQAGQEMMSQIAAMQGGGNQQSQIPQAGSTTDKANNEAGIPRDQLNAGGMTAPGA